MKLPAVMLLAAALTACATSGAPLPPSGPVLSMDEILARSPDADWRPLDPENTVYMELPAGRVVIALAPAYAPNHVADLKALARGGFFDGASVLRLQDNYVAQWGRPESDRSPVTAQRRNLPPEFERPVSSELPFTALPDPDAYAPEVGFSDGFPVAGGGGETWLAHCYGMVGAGRDVAPDSGGAGELYAVIGHAPRHLDRNVTLLGRVVQGVDLLSSLPRGTGDIGFYETAEEFAPIASMRVAADLAETDRTPLEMLRTDSATFAALVEARRNRRDEWFARPAGATELCNVPLPVRAAS